MNEMTKLQPPADLIEHPAATTLRMCFTLTEVDGVVSGPNAYQIAYVDIVSTAFSLVLRLAAIYINISLALSYEKSGQHDYFVWTTLCIALPIVVTMLLHVNMCYQDGKFNKSLHKSIETIILVILSALFFRYWKSMLYSIKCKQAQNSGNREAQIKYYKLTVREESDVAFIRLFECFLEAAPQKILQISIVLAHVDKMTNMQIIAICSYFGSMSWCLAAYHRSNRFAQMDKYNVSFNGTILQLCWHFCISVSRTMCISFVACLFPIWTLLACLAHVFISGIVTFIVDRPPFTTNWLANLMFSIILGIVYLFTYIAVKDAPTRSKYTLYYIFCFLENIACVALFVQYASSDLVSLAYLFYPLCAITLIFYLFGIVFMIIYYLYFHPRITARKHIVNQN